MMTFETMVENCLQSRNVFTNMNETQRREFLDRVLHEVTNNEPFGRMLFDINMIKSWDTRQSVYYQFATAIARYYYNVVREAEPNDNIVNFMLDTIRRLTRRKLDEQENAKGERVGR